MKPYKNHIATILVAALLLPVAMVRADSAGAGLSPDGEFTGEENTNQAPERTAQIQTTISRYQSLIQQLEAEHGVYYPAIAEALLGLGMAYKDLESHDEAADTFQRAMQISRVNQGLHSFDQLPYLEFLIKENREMENWEELNKNYQYLYWVNKRNYGENNPRLLDVIDRVTDAQIEIFNSNPELLTAEALVDRETMINRAVKIIEVNYGENDPRLIKAYNQLVQTNYYMALETGYFYKYRRYQASNLGAHFGTRHTLVRVPVGVINGRVVYANRIVDIPDTQGRTLPPEISRKFELIREITY